MHFQFLFSAQTCKNICASHLIFSADFWISSTHSAGLQISLTHILFSVQIREYLWLKVQACKYHWLTFYFQRRLSNICDTICQHQSLVITYRGMNLHFVLFFSWRNNTLLMIRMLIIFNFIVHVYEITFFQTEDICHA